MEKKDPSRCADICIISVTAVAAVWLLMRYAVGILLPICIAIPISALLRPIAEFIGKRSRSSARVFGGILVFLLLFISAYAALTLCGSVANELSKSIENIADNLSSDDNMIHRMITSVSELGNRIPLLSGSERNGESVLSDEIYETVIGAARECVAALSSSITSLAANLIRSMPSAVFSLAVSIIAIFYLTCDHDGVASAFEELLPRGVYDKISSLANGISGALTGYLRAYLTLMLITFAELFLGFTILRIKYSLPIATLTAFIDFLPILGTGTVLLPWAAISILCGDTYRGWGLLILFVVIYVIRQLAEPKIVGSFIGLHPMLTLCSAYIGFRVAGVLGMACSPIILYTVKLALGSGKYRTAGEAEGIGKKGGASRK